MSIKLKDLRSAKHKKIQQKSNNLSKTAPGTAAPNRVGGDTHEMMESRKRSRRNHQGLKRKRNKKRETGSKRKTRQSKEEKGEK